MPEPTEPTQPPPPVPPTEAPSSAAEGAAPPPPPTTWSTAAAATPSGAPYAAPPVGAPTVGRNLAIGVAIAALVIGAFLGALIAHVAGDTGSNQRTGIADSRSGQMGPNGGQGEMPMRPRGVDPDGNGGTNGRRQAPGRSAPSTPTSFWSRPL